MTGARTHKAKSLLLGPPLAAAFLAAVYVYSLHPASGAAGGLLFLLVGWAIPSVIPVLLALWVAALCRGMAVRVTVFALFLVLASANTNLPALVGQATSAPETEWRVERPIERREGYDFRVSNAIEEALARPALPKVSWHGSTRCMCLSLKVSAAASYRGALNEFFGENNLMFAPDQPNRWPFLSYELAPEDGGGATVTVRVHDKEGVAATFHQRGVPLALIPDTGGDGLAGADTVAHAVDLLLHDSVWMDLMSSWMTG
ncbi:MAG: hypothetical protein HQL39_18720, partial [Alphaproteobacteria bacterium]|nr:hypothetical protein [Alphaproteobacteria bacterium]